MNNINLNIKNIVSKNLNDKRNKILQESFTFDTDLELNNLIEKHVAVTLKLINEGYSINEIADYIDKAGVSSLNPNNGKFDYGQAFKDSMLSMAREYAIKFILEYVGFSPSTATKLGIALADISYKDLLIPFKNREYCNKHLPNILDSILEVYIRNYLGKKLRFKKTKEEDEDLLKKAEDNKQKRKAGEDIEKFIPRLSTDRYNWRDVPEIGLGNILGDVVRKTPTSEAISEVLCKIIHK